VVVAGLYSDGGKCKLCCCFECGVVIAGDGIRVVVDYAKEGKISGPGLVVFRRCQRDDGEVMSEVVNSPKEGNLSIISFYRDIFSIKFEYSRKSSTEGVGEFVVIRKPFEFFMYNSTRL
jgi:hypothetical protein